MLYACAAYYTGMVDARTTGVPLSAPAAEWKLANRTIEVKPGCAEVIRLEAME